MEACALAEQRAAGHYLQVGFARHFKELVVHRFTGLSRCEAGEGDSGALPSDARAFSRWRTHPLIGPLHVCRYMRPDRG